MKVVIIDDDVDFCMLFAKMLEAKQLEIHTAHTMVRGLELIEQTDPEVIFIDNYLPDHNGWETAARIFKHAPEKKINLISAEDKSFWNIHYPECTIWQKPITKAQLENYFNVMGMVP
jgi:two-component SAPR family response regulator